MTVSCSVHIGTGFGSFQGQPSLMQCLYLLINVYQLQTQECMHINMSCSQQKWERWYREMQGQVEAAACVAWETWVKALHQLTDGAYRSIAQVAS